MTDWTTIPNTSIETGKPIRAVDGRALRDNPIAIAEGASGAPRVQGPALNTAFAPVYVSGTTPAGFTGLSGVRAISIPFKWKADSTNAVLQVRYSTDNGSTWSSYYTLNYADSNYSNYYIIGEMYFDFVSGWGTYAGQVTNYNGAAGWPASSTITVTPNANAIQFRFGLAGSNGYFACRIAGGV